MTALSSERITALETLLGRVARDYAPSALASSLSAEDMVITDAVLRLTLDIEMFTLDTGRMPADTLNLIGAIRERYGYEVAAYRPEPSAVAGYVTRFGRDAFYR